MKSNPTNMQPEKFNIETFNTLLKEYSTIVFLMADCAAQLKEEYGNQVVELLGIDRNLFLKLCAIAKVKDKAGLTPEHIYELVGRKDAAKWAKTAKQKKWKPTELRRQLRQKDKTFKKEKKPENISDIPRQIILLKNRIARLPDNQREAMGILFQDRPYIADKAKDVTK